MGTINPSALGSPWTWRNIVMNFFVKHKLKKKKCVVFLLCSEYTLGELKIVTDGVRIILEIRNWGLQRLDDLLKSTQWVIGNNGTL